MLLHYLLAKNYDNWEDGSQGWYDNPPYLVLNEVIYGQALE